MNSDSEYLSSDVPANLVERFGRARSIVEAYASLSSIAENYQYNLSLEYLVNGDDIGEIEARIQELSCDLSEPLFDLEWLEEVAKARSKFAGNFRPVVYDNRALETDSNFESAFAFVDAVSIHFSQVNFDQPIDFPGIPRTEHTETKSARFGFKDDDEQIRAFVEALQVAFVLLNLALKMNCLQFSEERGARSRE